MPLAFLKFIERKSRKKEVDVVVSFFKLQIIRSKNKFHKILKRENYSMRTFKFKRFMR